MTDHRSDDDLLALLGRALSEAEPVPVRLADGARAAHTWHDIDGELAQLVYDSSREGELAKVRSDDDAREMTFEAPGVEIEIMVHGTSREVLGQLVPPREADIALAVGDRVEETRSDELGRFRFEDVSPGPIRLTVVSADPGETIQTEWVVI